jgi:hypothetical protein
MSGRTDASKNSASYRIQVSEARRLWMPDVDKIMETRHFRPEFSVPFESEEWPSMKPKSNHGGTHNKTWTSPVHKYSKCVSLA